MTPNHSCDRVCYCCALCLKAGPTTQPQPRLVPRPKPHRHTPMVGRNNLDKPHTPTMTTHNTSWSGTRHPLPATTRRRILERDNHTCQQCHGTQCGNLDLRVDHIIPIAEGGTDADENLQTLGQTPCHDNKTRNEIARGKQRRSTNRPKPTHPGLRPPRHHTPGG